MVVSRDLHHVIKEMELQVSGIIIEGLAQTANITFLFLQQEEIALPRQNSARLKTLMKS